MWPFAEFPPLRLGSIPQQQHKTAKQGKQATPSLLCCGTVGDPAGLPTVVSRQACDQIWGGVSWQEENLGTMLLDAFALSTNRRALGEESGSLVFSLRSEVQRKSHFDRVLEVVGVGFRSIK